VPGIDDSLREAMTIPGVLGVGLVDSASGLAVGSAGRWPHGDEPAAASATEVLRAALENTDFAESEQGDVLEDIVVASQSRYHVLRLLNPRYSGSDATLFLYLWLDRDRANLAIARRSLATLADDLVLS
jgi:hypothetical protein